MLFFAPDVMIFETELLVSMCSMWSSSVLNSGNVDKIKQNVDTTITPNETKAET